MHFERHFPQFPGHSVDSTADMLPYNYRIMLDYYDLNSSSTSSICQEIRSIISNGAIVTSPLCTPQSSYMVSPTCLPTSASTIEVPSFSVEFVLNAKSSLIALYPKDPPKSMVWPYFV